jgi:hypothetical protein
LIFRLLSTVVTRRDATPGRRPGCARHRSRQAVELHAALEHFDVDIACLVSGHRSLGFDLRHDDAVVDLLASRLWVRVEAQAVVTTRPGRRRERPRLWI